MRYRQWATIGTVAVVFAPVGGCALSGPATVTLHYVLQPQHPLAQRVHRVAVAPIEADTPTDARWSRIAVDWIAREFNAPWRRDQPRMRVVDAQRTGEVLDAAGLSADDLLDGLGAPEARELAVQAYLISRVHVETVRQPVGTVRVSRYPGQDGSTTPTTRRDETIEQTISVRADLAWVDVDSGKVRARYGDGVRVREQSAPRGWFGLGRSRPLSKPDDVAARFLRQAVGAFVGQMLPRRITRTVAVDSSANLSCGRGVSLLRDGRYAEALVELQQALEADPNDDRAMFAAGVASEVLGRRGQALEFYQQACLIKERPRYVQERDRLARELLHRSAKDQAGRPR